MCENKCEWKKKGRGEKGGEVQDTYQRVRRGGSTSEIADEEGRRDKRAKRAAKINKNKIIEQQK